MGILKKILLSVGILIIAIVFVIVGFHAYLYLQNKTFAIQIPYLGYIVRLGKIPESSYPKSLDDSFTYFVSRGGNIARIPKYIDDAIVDSELNGDLYAHDIRSGERKLYYWQDETSYVCVNTKEVGPVLKSSAFTIPDPKETLSNYHFIFSEYGVRGETLLSGLAHFESDVRPGMPIKLILKNRTKNEDGAYDLITIFLFTDQECSKYPV